MKSKITAFLLALALMGSGPALAEPSYDMFQQVFTLSMLSNAASGVKGQGKAELEKLFVERANSFLGDSAVTPLIGKWSIAWGPVVFQFCSDESGFIDKAFCALVGDATKKATNAMVVLKRQTPTGDQYVVGIAATNPVSKFDWVVEDGSVRITRPWKFGDVPAGKEPRISLGTSIGLSFLMGLEDPTTNRTLVQFLKTAGGAGNELYFVGHSLAGALSPSLALAYFNNGAALDRKQWKSIQVYPSAGPTPGNGDFSELFASIFPNIASGSKPYAHWNADIWNSLDVVPHAWMTGDYAWGTAFTSKSSGTSGTLAEVPHLYGSLELDDQFKVDALIVAARGLAAGNDYTKISNQRLTGTLKGRVRTYADFTQQMVYQHVEAYAGLIGVEAAAKVLRRIMTP